MAGVPRDIKKLGTLCPICGKPDWCLRIDFNDEHGTRYLHYCHRMIDVAEGETVTGIDAQEYRCIGYSSEGFAKFESIEQQEENRRRWCEEHGKAYKKGGTYKPSSKRQVSYSSVREEETVEDCAPLAVPARLHEVYSAWLDLLVLEPKHEKKLRDEWDKGIENVGIGFDYIIARWPIKSLPPDDYIRFDSNENYLNKSRKTIMEELIERVGEPIGVPGFYQKKDKDGVLHWAMFSLCGIIYPIYNSYGQIIRVRVNDDHPVCGGTFQGMEGNFMYLRPKGVSGRTGWYFVPNGEDGRANYANQVLVYRTGYLQNLIELTSKGYPKGSKVSGKYKNFSSYEKREEKTADGKVRRYNRFMNGVQSGSSLSLYTTPGDNEGVVLITEGEKKAIVANAVYKVPVICLPGVNSYKKLFEPEEGYKESVMDRLYQRGLRTPVIIYDADKAENKAVAVCEYKAIAEFWNRDKSIYRGNFSEAWGKGLDDITLAGLRFIPQKLKKPENWNSE